MPTERWLRVERLFTEAAEQPAGQRAQFLAWSCGPDRELRDEVASLLRNSEECGDFLSAPALDLFARQISHEGWSVKPGDRIASYTVERRLGAGGMGEVWRARDERLGRAVAIKLLLPDASTADQRVRALQREARAAGALNHVNVLTVHDVGHHGGSPYLVTECLEGEPLRARLAAGALPVDQALDVALQVARGLGAAHRRGIVHRDLKPENIFLAGDGLVKILDFGLATLHGAAPASAGPTAELIASLAAGTAGYMAPEQLRGESVDGRADIFALGAVLHETLAGCRPFRAASTLETLEAVLTLPAPRLPEDGPISPALARLVRRCLARSPDDRPSSVAELVSALEQIIRERNQPPLPGVLAVLRRPMVAAGLSLMVLAIGAGVWRGRAVSARVHWARSVAAPAVELSLEQGDPAEAFTLARQALEAAPDDRHLQQLWHDVSTHTDLTTDPPGALVEFAPYRNSKASWSPLGITPLEGVRIPDGFFRVRITKAGFEPIEGSSASGEWQRYRLDPAGTLPPGMVRVVGGPVPTRPDLFGALDDFWFDRFEITNRQFQEFVDRGGYRHRELWSEPFQEGGRTLSWEEAMGRLRDGSGSPGPATWRGGHYPEGQADFPVGGVSWYEASAYAKWAGKALPTIHHWYRAAAMGRFDDILMVSNFEGRGPAPVGSHRGLGAFGTYDMAGNLKEWCSTEDSGRRYLLGGAWNEPRYMFADDDARDPFERAPSYGFRTARYLGPLSPTLTGPVRREDLTRDARQQNPVSDEVFAVYRRMYAYDRGPLNAMVEATETTEVGIRQTITFDAAYGGERMRAHLFLPRTASPPYQVVIFFPPADALSLRSSRDMSLGWLDFIVGSGRAFLQPVYKGTYERSGCVLTGPNAERDLRVAWSRDLGRAIDYLETRPDVDRDRLAFYGVSSGADAGVVLTALEPRFKASILQSTGIWDLVAPEIDPLNFAPRVRVPTLMLNGRYDFEAPYETAQRALFARLGTAPQDKEHRVLEYGHALPMAELAGAILPWLDRHLGPARSGP